MAVNPSDTPPPPRLPCRGAVGVPAGPARCQLTTSPSPRPLTSQGSPTWASVVRGEACPSVEKATCPGSQPAVTAADFSALYQRCMASGLKARTVISHAAGCQIFTVSCNIPVPAMTKTVTGRRRCRRLLHHRPFPHLRSSRLRQKNPDDGETKRNFFETLKRRGN
jgi:hypothetical protein